MIYYNQGRFTPSLWNQNYIDLYRFLDLMRILKIRFTNNIKREDFISFCTFLYFLIVDSDRSIIDHFS